MATKQQIVAGALMDFIGSLSTLPEPMTVWAGTEVYPLHEHFQKWAETRGLNLTGADVQDWQKGMTAPDVGPFVSKLSDDDHLRIEAVIRDGLNRILLPPDRGARAYVAPTAEQRALMRVEYVDGQFSHDGVHDFIIALCKHLGIVPEASLDQIMEFELFINGTVGTVLAVSYLEEFALKPPEVVFKQFDVMARPTRAERKLAVTQEEGTDGAAQEQDGQPAAVVSEPDRAG